MKEKTFNVSVLSNLLDAIYKSEETEFYPQFSNPREIEFYSSSSFIPCGIKLSEMNQRSLFPIDSITNVEPFQTENLQFTNIFLTELQKQEKLTEESFEKLQKEPQLTPSDAYPHSKSKHQIKSVRAPVSFDHHSSTLEMLSRRSKSQRSFEGSIIGSQQINDTTS